MTHKKPHERKPRERKKSHERKPRERRAGGKLSVVIPTLREAANLEAVAVAVRNSLKPSGRIFEILFIDDDSGDGSEEISKALARRLPVRFLRRTRNHGLAQAVVDGVQAARGVYVAVMDADLSHPPQALPPMVALLESGKADFVIGSRYAAGGGVEAGWPWWRRLNAWGARLLARPLVPARDPLSGFFAFRRGDMPDFSVLAPLGYKIGLEILVKGDFTAPREWPITFRDRRQGKSKLSLRQHAYYLRHLRRLYAWRWPRRAQAVQFFAIGGSGLVLDVALYELMQELLGLSHITARALSFWPAVSWNWLLNRAVTFKERRRASPLRQWGLFSAFSAMGFVVSWGSYVALTSYSSFFSASPVAALALGVVLAAAFNFLCAERFVFPASRQRP